MVKFSLISDVIRKFNIQAELTAQKIMPSTNVQKAAKCTTSAKMLVAPNKAAHEIERFICPPYDFSFCKYKSERPERNTVRIEN